MDMHRVIYQTERVGGNGIRIDKKEKGEEKESFFPTSFHKVDFVQTRGL